MTEGKGVPDGASQEVRCSCGVFVSIGESEFGRESTCPSCGVKFKVVWALDPRTRDKVATRVPAQGPALRIPPGSHEVTCVCGQPLVVRKDQAGKKVKCPVCNTSMVLEKFKDPQTLETKVRRAAPKGKEVATAVIAAKPLGRTTRRRKAPTGAQDILCACGENLRVFAEHLDKRVMCPACGVLMKLDKHKDPETSVTTVRPRIVGKAEPPAKTDPDDWSLSDFH